MNSKEKVVKLIDKLEKKHSLSKKGLLYILENIDDDLRKYLHNKARSICDTIYGRKIYLRGLIEFGNYCIKECAYCGINKFSKIKRYKLSYDEIFNIISFGINLGYKSFVLQSGEEKKEDYDLVELVKKIKANFGNIALTMSIGEKSYSYYKDLKDAGVDRFLLRHETSNKKVYKILHNESSKKRIKALYNLKKIKYQTGAGFIVGLFNLKLKDYVDDLIFLKRLNPEMVGIGPFIPSSNTKLKDYKKGSVDLTVDLLSLIRLLLPNVLLPATTALATADLMGTIKGLNAGCNVIMPNITPCDIAKCYNLYDNKKIDKTEDGKNLDNLKNLLMKNNYIPCLMRGDYKSNKEENLI